MCVIKNKDNIDATIYSEDEGLGILLHNVVGTHCEYLLGVFEFIIRQKL